MTQHDWLELVAWMCQLWPHSPIEPDTAGAWWPFIAHLNPDRARHAIATLALEPGRRFPPGIGDIIHAAEPAQQRDWWDAWTDVYDAIAGTSGRIRYTGDDPRIADFIDKLGEWREQVDESNPALRAQFRDYWHAADNSTRRRRSDMIAQAVVNEITPVADALSLPAADRDLEHADG